MGNISVVKRSKLCIGLKLFSVVCWNLFILYVHDGAMHTHACARAHALGSNWLQKVAYKLCWILCFIEILMDREYCIIKILLKNNHCNVRLTSIYFYCNKIWCWLFICLESLFLFIWSLIQMNLKPLKGENLNGTIGKQRVQESMRK